MPKLTKKIVDAAKPQEKKRYIVWDQHLVGFGLLVLPTGVKSYLFNYRLPDGRGRRITIGQHGQWTPDQARRKAEELRQQVRAGSDPLATRRTFKDSPTLSDVLDAYLESDPYKAKTTTTQAIDRGRFDRHLRPLLGNKRAYLLSETDIKRALVAIREGRTRADVKTGPRGLARVRGGETTARDTIGLLKTVLNWAVSEKIIKTNPAAGLKLGGSRVRETILQDAEDYGRLFETLDKMERELRIRPQAADAIRLIALTGCRRGEAANLRWRHVDLKQGRVVLPAAEHKSGHKTRKPRIITLPAAAQAIIARQPEGEPDDFVFAPSRGSGALALSRVWNKVRHEAELPDGIGLHGLRHSVGSHMAMAGAQAAEIMQQLGHHQLSTTSRYIHWAENARQGLAEKAAATALAGMAAAKGSGKVVKLKGRRA